MRIISIGLMAGVLFFLPIALMVRNSMTLSNSLDILSGIASGWAVLSVPIADVFRKARWPTTTPEQDSQYWARCRGAHIVSMGLVEGPALFCCVALMIAKPWWPLAAILLPLGAMLAWFPRDPS